MILFIKRCLSLILLGTLLAGCASENQEASRAQSPVPVVEAVKSSYGALPLTERLTGVVRAKNQVAIHPEISAPITEVYVRDGEYVEKGQPLIRLRDNRLRNQLQQTIAAHQIAIAQQRQAEARLKEIRAELKRTRSLAEKDLASPAELEAVETRAVSAEADLELARARIKQAEANVEEREEALSKTVIRAPVSGYVGSRDAEVGMLVSGNARLFTLGQLDEIEIEVILTDRMLNYIKTGQRVEVFPQDVSLDPITGSVSRISPFLNQVTHTTQAEIDLSNPGRELKPGMFVAVDIHYGESENATLVPPATLYEDPATGVTGVYITRDSLSRAVPADSVDIEKIPLTGPLTFEFTEIKVIARGRMETGVDGIEPGLWVVSLGQDLIGGASGKARVRPVNHEWVHRLQRLQRQDLLQEVMRQHQEPVSDSTSARNQSSPAR